MFFYSIPVCFFFFFFQAEDGIRDHCVTGVQTCALPISSPRDRSESSDRILVSELSGRSNIMALTSGHSIQNDREVMDKILARVVELENQIGRASCRERV